MNRQGKPGSGRPGRRVRTLSLSLLLPATLSLRHTLSPRFEYIDPQRVRGEVAKRLGFLRFLYSIRDEKTREEWADGMDGNGRKRAEFGIFWEERGLVVMREYLRECRKMGRKWTENGNFEGLTEFWELFSKFQNQFWCFWHKKNEQK